MRSQSRTRRRTLLLAVFVLLTLGVARRLLGCFGPDYWTVHFRGDRPDFFQMPQPWRGHPEEHQALPGAADTFGGTGRDEVGLLLATGTISLPKRAMQLEAKGQYRQAARVWEHYRRAEKALDRDNFELWEAYRRDRCRPGVSTIESRRCARGEVPRIRLRCGSTWMPATG
jgi:hypothetical protein